MPDERPIDEQQPKPYTVGGNKGGRRPGAGRKKGSKNKLTLEREAIVKKSIELGVTPLEYMLQVLRDKKTSRERRDAMAIAAAPYIHPRLQAVEHKGEGAAGLLVVVQKLTTPLEEEKPALPAPIEHGP